MNNLRQNSSVPFDSDSSPRDPFAKHFIPRPGSRRKGLSIDFDPEKHRDWVTGFQKRRSERKTAARKSLETRVKQERLEERRKKFERRKQELNLPDDYGVDDGDVGNVESKELVADSKKYTFAGTDSIVTTTAIALESDSSEGETDESDDNHEPLAVLAPAVQMKKFLGDESGSNTKEPQGKDRVRGKHRNVALSSAAQRLNKLKQGKNVKKGKGVKGSSKSPSKKRGKSRKGPKR